MHANKQLVNNENFRGLKCYRLFLQLFGDLVIYSFCFQLNIMQKHIILHNVAIQSSYLNDV